jgi:undecaprenyl-diphosphatase
MGEVNREKIMSDTSVYLWINGLSGKVAAIDELFKGISNDYFAVITACLVLVWLWFATRDIAQREKNQRTVLTTMISIGIASALMLLINHYYFRTRPFDNLPASSINLLFYKPTDSSFPSNYAAILFAIAIAVFIKNKKYGSWLLGLAVLSGFGRVYLGIHYPLDILGGAAVGLVATFISIGIMWIIRPLADLILKIIRVLNLA